MMTPKQILALLKHDGVRSNPTRRTRSNPKQSVTVHKTKSGFKFCRTISKPETKRMAKLFDSVRGNPRKRGYQVETRSGMKRFSTRPAAISYAKKHRPSRVAGPNGPTAMFGPAPITDAEIRRRYERGVLDVKRKGGSYSAFGVITASLYRAHGKRRVQRALAPLRAKAAKKSAATKRRHARKNPVITMDLTPAEVARWRTEHGRNGIVGKANAVYNVSRAPIVISANGVILATRTDSGWVFT